MLQIKPLRDRIYAEVEPANQESGGILIPDTARSNPLVTAIVLAVSDGWLEDGQNRSPAVEIGDRILINIHAGDDVVTDIRDRGPRRKIIREEQVLGIVLALEGKE